VQLDTPAASIASSTNQTSAFPRRFQPNGINTSTHATGTNLHPAGPADSEAAVDCPVEICAITFPVTPAFSVSLAGLNMQSAFAGGVPHWNANVPCDPASGVITIVKLAVCPLETVWLVEPFAVTVKSKPIPVSDTAAEADAVLLVTLKLPDCAPALVGANTTPTTQLAPAASVVPQVLLTN
jgi:hypothetical protein